GVAYRTIGFFKMDKFARGGRGSCRAATSEVSVICIAAQQELRPPKIMPILKKPDHPGVASGVFKTRKARPGSRLSGQKARVRNRNCILANDANPNALPRKWNSTPSPTPDWPNCIGPYGGTLVMHTPGGRAHRF